MSWILPNQTANIYLKTVKLQGIRQGENVTFTSEIFNPNKHPLDGFAAERMFIPPESVVPSSCGQLCVRICGYSRTISIALLPPRLSNTGS